MFLLAEKTSKIDWFIENILLCKLQFWKNNPRGHYLIIRAFFLALIWQLICVVINVILDDPLSIDLARRPLKFFGTFPIGSTIIFWNINRTFKLNWQYCANQYNAILHANFEKRGETKLQLLRSSLAIDLLIHDLWAQRAFRSFFEKELCEASGCDLDKLHNKITENQALTHLEKHHEKHQKIFENEIKNETKNS